MQLLKKTFLNWIKKIFSDSHSAIVGIILGSIIVSGGGIYVFFRNLWTELIIIIQSPTPLWATIALTLLIGTYIYLKSRKYTPPLPAKQKYKVNYFSIGNFKWKAAIYDSNRFDVDKYPFCIKHDLQFIFGTDGKYCPGTEKERCNNRLSQFDEFKVYESAKSIIENKIRNKDY